MMTEDFIELKNVSVHNLKNVDLNLHKNRLTVFTGVSGSGKSSMAFDTIYMEGQRRYIESLPSFARRQMSDIVKPDVKSVTGISPTISIEQKTVGRNPRSTVGTLTEVYDYLRVLFARVGTAHCPESNEVLKPQSRESIISAVLNEYDSQKIIIFAPIASGKKGEFKEQFLDLQRRGFTKVRVNGELFDLFEDISLDPSAAHSIEVVIDRLSVTADLQARVAESITLALEVGAGACSVKHYQTEKEQLFSTHAFSQKSGKYYYDLEPQDFSFNSPAGMCPKCMGLGKSYEFCLDKIIEKDKSIAEDCCALASSYDSVRFGNIYRGLARKFKFKVDAPWKKLSKKAQDIFLYGTEDKWTSIVFIHPVTKKRWTEYVHWRGVVTDAHTKLKL